MTVAPDHAEGTYGFLAGFFGQLVAEGVEHAVVSPGSRSTPLTVAADRTEGLRLWIHHDERSAAFFGLGLAKSSDAPVVLICTSGTAAANYVPAMAEAGHSAVRLIALTADRPPELRGVGAGQTIDQQHLMKNGARFVEMGPVDEMTPTAGPEFARLVVRLGGGRRHRPVHVNVPLREPLEPPADAPEVPPLLGQSTALEPEHDEIDHVRTDEDRFADLAHRSNGLIIAGPSDGRWPSPSDLHDLSAATGWPIIAEPASGLRRDGAGTVIAHGDQIFRTRWATEHRPAVIVRAGLSPTSKPYRLWLEAGGVDELVLIDPDRLNNEPTDSTTLHIEWRRPLPSAGSPDAAWTDAWIEADHRATAAIGAVIADQPFDEPAVARVLERELGADTNLFVTNSMPIRDVDAFFERAADGPRVWASRGANGIDGQTSTALGVAAATGSRTVLLTGDVAFLHDIGGLLHASRFGLPLTVVLVDNDGGGIFSFLPIAEHDDVDHDRLFHTPHGLDLTAVGPLAGADVDHATTEDELVAALQKSKAATGPVIIRVPTDATENRRQHRLAASAVAAALDGSA